MWQTAGLMLPNEMSIKVVRDTCWRSSARETVAGCNFSQLLMQLSFIRTIMTMKTLKTMTIHLSNQLWTSL